MHTHTFVYICIYTDLRLQAYDGRQRLAQWWGWRGVRAPARELDQVGQRPQDQPPGHEHHNVRGATAALAPPGR